MLKPPSRTTAQHVQITLVCMCVPGSSCRAALGYYAQEQSVLLCSKMQNSNSCASKCGVGWALPSSNPKQLNCTEHHMQQVAAQLSVCRRCTSLSCEKTPSTPPAENATRNSPGTQPPKQCASSQQQNTPKQKLKWTPKWSSIQKHARALRLGSCSPRLQCSHAVCPYASKVRRRTQAARALARPCRSNLRTATLRLAR